MVASNVYDTQLKGLGEWVVIESYSKGKDWMFRKQDFSVQGNVK